MAELDISAVVKTSIEMKILEAFRETPQMIDELVKACLESEVNEHGGKPDFHDRCKMPYLTFLARQAVRGVAAEAVKKYVSEMEEEINAQVRESLAAADVVDAFTKNIISATSQDWKLNVEFKAENK